MRERRNYPATVRRMGEVEQRTARRMRGEGVRLGEIASVLRCTIANVRSLIQGRAVVVRRWHKAGRVQRPNRRARGRKDSAQKTACLQQSDTQVSAMTESADENVPSKAADA